MCHGTPPLDSVPFEQNRLVGRDHPLDGHSIGIRAVRSDNTQMCLGRRKTLTTAFTQAEQETRLVLGERIK